MFTARGATLTLRFFDPAQAPASVALTVTLNVPVTVGVPVICPLAALIEIPAGKPTDDQRIVPLPPAWVNVLGLIAVLKVSRGRVPLTVMTGQPAGPSAVEAAA